jgi:hypothetical protein
LFLVGEPRGLTPPGLAPPLCILFLTVGEEQWVNRRKTPRYTQAKTKRVEVVVGEVVENKPTIKSTKSTI